MSEKQRLYGVLILQELNEKKGYKTETLFLAIDIFDRYFTPAGNRMNINCQRVVLTALTSMMIAAKVSNSLQPCYDNMVRHLQKKEIELVSL